MVECALDEELTEMLNTSHDRSIWHWHLASVMFWWSTLNKLVYPKWMHSLCVVRGELEDDRAYSSRTNRPNSGRMIRIRPQLFHINMCVCACAWVSEWVSGCECKLQVVVMVKVQINLRNWVRWWIFIRLAIRADCDNADWLVWIDDDCVWVIEFWVNFARRFVLRKYEFWFECDTSDLMSEG
jgi:hypothetical protein